MSRTRTFYIKAEDQYKKKYTFFCFKVEFTIDEAIIHMPVSEQNRNEESLFYWGEGEIELFYEGRKITQIYFFSRKDL